MKREGRQHGFVRTGMIHPSGFNPKPSNQFLNRLDSPRDFTKVSSKPTNHSKSTGKRERSKYSNCHVSPAIKPAAKSKGRQKLESTDWWVDDELNRLTGLDASSARDILDTLCGEVSKTTNYGECIYEELCDMGKSGSHECFIKCSKKNKKYTGGKCIPKNPEYGYCCCTI
ncbi:hypothetical protein N665_0280s0025 [Sinapis alba]|nr:hypothetical protein N665_0280s0025 [Sinapis alba]